MARFVLVHGAWHGAWCFDALARDLAAAGHEVDTFDLPGHGSDATPHDEVTLDTYAQRVAEVIGQDGEPVVLVGHSMGGIVVTQAAELVPERIARLVYLTAFLPKDGESLQYLAGLPREPRGHRGAELRDRAARRDHPRLGGTRRLLPPLLGGRRRRRGRPAQSAAPPAAGDPGVDHARAGGRPGAPLHRVHRRPGHPDRPAAAHDQREPLRDGDGDRRRPLAVHLRGGGADDGAAGAAPRRPRRTRRRRAPARRRAPRWRR